MAMAALAASARTAAPSGLARAPCPRISIGRSAPSSVLQEWMRAVGDLGERLGAGAEIVIGISEIVLGADQADGNLRLGLTASA